MKSNSVNEINGNFLIKWQEITDLIASVINIPAALIIKAENEFREVLISSNTENNPYHNGDKEKWNGFYCETVINSQNKLLIPDAKKDKDWDKNPDIKTGMIAYLGFPINFPDNQPFGTICVLDNKDNSFLPEHEQLMLHFKNVIESDLSLMQDFEIKINELSGTISELQSQLLTKNIELNTFKEKAELKEIDLKRVQERLIKTKEQAQESEEKYRAFYNNAPLSYQSLDENGCFIDVNPMWLKTLGCERDEVIGKWYGDFLHPDYVEHFKTNFPAFKKRGYISDVQFKLRKKDNTFIVVSFEGCIGYTPEGKFKQTYCVFKDITEQKALEQHLIIAKEKAEESERNIQLINEELEMFKTIADNAVYGKVISDLKGNIIYINKFLANIHGYTPEELTGRNISLFYNQKQMEEVGRLYESLIKNGNFASTEVWHINIKGSEFPMLMSGTLIKDATGNPLFLAASAVDVTERKQTEEALRRSEVIKNTMVSNIGDVIVIIDQNGVNQYKSPNITKLFGWKPEELVGKNTWDNIHPDDLESVQKLFGTIATEPNATGTIELRYKRKDGNYVWIETKAINLLHDRDIQGILGNYHDISERKRAEQELLERNKEYESINEELNQANLELVAAYKKAEESDRLKSAFLANMSHEIRTPMNGILGFAYLLKKPGLKGEKQQAYIGIIEKSGKRMLNIINDIVDISKIEAGLMELDINESNINEQIEDIYTFFKPEAEANGINLSIKYPLPAKELTLKTDGEKLNAILANLVKNAIKYTEKGSIELGYIIKTNTKPGELEFYVKDTGIGIPKDRQEVIFDRFIQADIGNKMAHQGAGLGLAITKSYVEMLGGKIRVESEEGKGSIFYFTLPYISEPAAEIIDRQIHPSGKTEIAGKLKILVAEDDEVSEILLDETVKMFAKEILKARTGVEAVKACRDNPDIDMILMDIRMPEMGGYEAAKQIRIFNKEVIIIAQTAYGQTGDREKSVESGCDDYLAKPFNEEELQAVILKYFGY